MQYKHLTKLWGFDYEIFCALGRANIVADGLSQIAEPPAAIFSSNTIC